MKFLNIIFFLLCSLAQISAQEALIEDIIEHINSNDDATNIDALTELLQELKLAPININTSSETELNNCMLFSPYQVFGILKYREKYGLYFSIYELQSIPGFNAEFLKLISPLITVDHLIAPKQKSHPKGMLLSDFSSKYPESCAYHQNDSTSLIYPGSPLKTIQRFKYNNSKTFSIGAAFEKDPGEIWQEHGQSEHLCGYLKFQPDKIFSNVIIGNYRVHRGLGLVHGLGFNASTSTSLNGYRRSYAKAFASGMEYKYYKGIYVESCIRKWTSDLFISSKYEDLSLYNFNPNTPLHQYIRETGIHRSLSEVNGKKLALRRTAGLSINRSEAHLKAGLSICYDMVSLTKNGKDSIPEFSDTYSTQTNISAYFITYGKKYELFGELAANQQINIAGIIGANWQINPALSLSSSYHYYDPGYSGQFPNAYSAGDKPANEYGFNLKANLVPINNVLLCINSDIYSDIESLTGSSEKYEIRNSLQLNYNSRSNFKCLLKYNHYSQAEESQQENTGAEKTYHSGKEKIRFHYELELLNAIVISGRIEMSNYTFRESYTTIKMDKNALNNTVQRGSLIYQQLKIKSEKKLQLTYRFLAFNIADWENRIYCYEPGVKYSFLFPAFYGTGTQNLLLLNYKPNRVLTFRSKIGYIEYQHKRETGSGNDIRPGNHVLNLELQMELTI